MTRLPPAVADLPRPVLGIAAGHPVDLVGSDAGLVLAVEQREEALAQERQRVRRDEPVLEDHEAVALEGHRFDPLTSGGALLRVVEREGDDRCGNALLVAVELAHLDLGAELGVPHAHPAQRDVLLQHRASACRS